MFELSITEIITKLDKTPSLPERDPAAVRDRVGDPHGVHLERPRHEPLPHLEQLKTGFVPHRELHHAALDELHGEARGEDGGAGVQGGEDPGEGAFGGGGY